MSLSKESPSLSSSNKMNLPIIGCVPPSIVHALIVITIVVMIAFMSKWLGEKKGKRYPDDFIKKIHHLVGEAARYNTQAEQDTNAAIALINATYALAYMNTARMLLPDEEIMRVCNIHSAEYVIMLTDTQQRAFQALGQICPAVQPETPYAMFTGYLA